VEETRTNYTGISHTFINVKRLYFKLKSALERAQIIKRGRRRERAARATTFTKTVIKQ
jgi:hypothetical protein